MLFPKQGGITFLLLTLSSLVLGTLFIVGISTPPSNLDSLHTHLTRVFYWLQHGSLANWQATGSFQLTYPINAHLQGLWVFLFGANENYFFLVPWVSLVVLCISIYEVARNLNFSVIQSFVSAMIVLTFPVVLLQVYSFQGDLVVAALFMLFIWLISAFFINKNPKELAAGLLALAISLGVKQTAFMIFPAIGVICIIALISKQIGKKHILQFGFFIIFLLIFSSFKYFQNQINFGSVFGFSDLVSGQKLTLQTSIEKAKYNIPRYLYGLIDFGGLGFPSEKNLTGIKGNVFRKLTMHNNIELDSTKFLAPGYDESEFFKYETPPSLTEDTASFGPLLFTLIPISWLVVLTQKSRPRKLFLLLGMLISLSYFCALLLQRPGWDPYQGRYFILGVVPFIPIVGVLIPNKNIFKIISIVLFSLLFVYLTFSILLFNSTKPLVTSSTIVSLQNEYILKIPEESKYQLILKNYLTKKSNKLVEVLPDLQTIYNRTYYYQLLSANTGDTQNITWINTQIKQDECLYLIITRSPLEYALFGKNRIRELFPISTLQEVPIGEKVLVQVDTTENFDGFILISANDSYALYSRVH